MQSSIAVFLGLCLTLVLPGAAAAQSSRYTYKAIEVPGSTLTLAFGINDRSEIVGGFNGTDGKGHGFLLSGGVFTVIDVPGALATFPRGINNRGQIVGDYLDSGNIVRGFLLSEGEFIAIAPPGSVYTIAYDINDAGQIAGVQGSFTQQRSLLWTHGQFVATDRPGAMPAAASGINQAGQLVSFDFTNQEGSRLDPDGALQRIRVPGAEATIPTGINDRGEIVGFWRSPSDNNLRGFRLAFGVFTPVNVPGASVTQPEDINNRGQIVGVTSGGAFLATPAGLLEDVSGLPSVSGTRVPVATFVVDGDLATWTLGPGQEILRDGIQAGKGYGSQILWYENAIYVLGDDSNWWLWAHNIWILVGPTDPSKLQ